MNFNAPTHKPDVTAPLVTVKRNNYSGSNFYVYGKGPGEIMDNLAQMMDSGIGTQGAMIQGAKSITKSVTAAMGWMGPWMTAGIDMYLRVGQQVNESLQRQLDQATRDFFSNGQMNTPEFAEAMIHYGRALPGDDEVNEQLNYRFFTHHRLRNTKSPAYGALHAAEPSDVLPYFDPDIPVEKWPNLVLASSHALVRDHLDVSGIMKGFHALISDAFRDESKPRGRDLPLIRHLPSGKADQPEKKPTILLSSVYNDHNAWVNGGTLIARLNHLDALYEAEAQHKDDNSPARQRWREREYLGQGSAAMSPASIRLAKLMLQLIVEDPAQIHVPGSADFEGWQGDLTQSFTQSDAPIKIRADADKVLQHIKLAGYSKGGNIVTDAMRYLLLELQHAPRGERLFETGEGEHAHPLSDREIGALMRNVGVLCVNPGIAPLTEREKELGIRRLTVRNENDRITGHLFDRHLAFSAAKNGSDDIYIVNPKYKGGTLGHDYADALGNRDASIPGYVIDPKRVRMNSTEERESFYELRSRLRAFFASCYEQVGISHVSLYNEAALIGFSTGITPEKSARVEQALLEKLQEQGMPATLQCDWRRDGKCIFYFGSAEQEQWKPALAKALQHLAHDPKLGVFIAHNAYRALGIEPPELEQQRAR